MEQKSFDYSFNNISLFQRIACLMYSFFIVYSHDFRVLVYCGDFVLIIYPYVFDWLTARSGGTHETQNN